MTQARRRAIAYLRVSTVDQKSGYGLDVQEQAVRTFAKEVNLRIVQVLRDEAISGTKGDDLRPALAEALLRLEAGDADVLLVPRLDRLARNLVLQETVIGRMNAQGREVLSVAEPDISAEDGQRTLIRQILGAISQYEGSLIAARLRAGREMKKARGGYAQGRPPYGYRAEAGSLIPVDAEQRVIARVHLLRSEGLSLREIAAALTREGLWPRTGEVWHPPQIARMLRVGSQTTTT